MRLEKRLLALFTVILLISGCASLKPAFEEAERPPSVVPTSMRARAIVEVKRGVFTVAGRASILAKAPRSFRIEVFGPFGQAMMLLASDGERLYVSSEGKTKEFHWGDPDIPYSFEAGEAVSFLTGSPRPAEAGLSPNINETRDRWGRLTEYSKAAEGRPTLKVTLSEYRDINGAHIPFRIRIEDGKRDLTIKYMEAEINPPLDEELFRLEASSDRGPKEVD